jgi:hypothetical protein
MTFAPLSEGFFKVAEFAAGLRGGLREAFRDY